MRIANQDRYKDVLQTTPRWGLIHDIKSPIGWPIRDYCYSNLRNMQILKKYLLLFYAFVVGVSYSQTTDWVSLPSELNQEAVALVEYDGKLVVGGLFNQAGNITANGIAAWDGSNWTTFGNGLGDTMSPFPFVYIQNMVSHDGNLYVAGQFSEEDGYIGNNIAMWDGTSWTNMAGGSNKRIFDLIMYNDELYVGGDFDTIGTVEANSIAKWDGTAWHSLDTVFKEDIFSLIVADFQIFDDKLYVAGGIPNVYGQSCITVAEFDGNTWTCVSDGLFYGIKRFGVWNDTLIGGNNLHLVNGNPIWETHKYNGTEWEIFSTQMPLPIAQDFTVYQGELYLSGGMPLVNDEIIPKVVKWDGSNWSRVGTGLTSIVTDALVFNDELYIAGKFNEENNAEHNYIAKLSHNVGIAEHDAPTFSFQLSPNPAKEITSIQIKNSTLTEGCIYLIDVYGRRLSKIDLETGIQQYDLEVSNYLSGVYFVELWIDNEPISTEQLYIVK